MDIKQITEIGVAVKDIEKATRIFVDLLGAEAREIVEVEMFQMRYRMCRLGKIDFEIMEPMGDSGVIADFINKNGEGIHHVAFAVKDVENGMEKLKEKGVKFISDGPMELCGSAVDNMGVLHEGNAKFTFSHPKSLAGILFEFIEYGEDFNL